MATLGDKAVDSSFSYSECVFSCPINTPPRMKLAVTALRASLTLLQLREAQSHNGKVQHGSGWLYHDIAKLSSCNANISSASIVLTLK